LEDIRVVQRILKLILEKGNDDVRWAFLNMVMELWVLPQDTANENVNINHLQ